MLRAAPFHDVKPIVLRDPNGHISKGQYLRGHAPKSFHCPILSNFEDADLDPVPVMSHAAHATPQSGKPAIPRQHMLSWGKWSLKAGSAPEISGSCAYPPVI